MSSKKKKTVTDPGPDEKRTVRERERLRANRETIFQAAESVICRKGLSAVSMDDVAEEAGFSKATLYRYVPSKAELVFELLVHFMEDLGARFKSIRAESSTPPERLRGFLREAIRFQREKENLARLFVLDPSFLKILKIFLVDADGNAGGQGRRYRRRLDKARRAISADFEEVLGEGEASGDFRSLPPGRGVFLIGALLQGVLHEKIWSRIEPNPDIFVSTLYDFVLRGIASPKMTPREEETYEADH